MTVHRSSDTTARPPEPASRSRQAKEPAREPVARQSVDQFRSMMQQARGEPGAESGMPAEGEMRGADGGDDTLAVDQASQHQALRSRQSAGDVVDARTVRLQQDTGTGSPQMPSAESAAMLQAQMALRDGSHTPAPAAPQADPGQLLDMMERHVRQLAVHDATQGGQDGQVLLRMRDATLPGTDLLLSRDGDGWVLRADSRSRESFDAIREAGPQLAQRFAERNLGTLTIDPHFHA